MITEKEAKTKLCPLMSTSVRGIDAASFEWISCCASECMAWRSEVVSLAHADRDGEHPETVMGWCGAFSTPATAASKVVRVEMAS